MSKNGLLKCYLPNKNKNAHFSLNSISLFEHLQCIIFFKKDDEVVSHCGPVITYLTL